MFCPLGLVYEGSNANSYRMMVDQSKGRSARNAIVAAGKTVAIEIVNGS